MRPAERAEFGDRLWPDATAASNGTRAEPPPVLDHIGREAVNADAAPRVRRPIPDTAVIRVDEERCVRCLARRLKEGVDVLWRSAVDPERLDPVRPAC